METSLPESLAEQSANFCLQQVPFEVLRSSVIPFLSSPSELARLRCAGGAVFSAALAGAAGIVAGVGLDTSDVAACLQHWEVWYRERWPQFHEHERYRLGSGQDWVRTYCETFCGQREFLLEVFERERDPGFAMSAVAARVRWVPSSVARTPGGAYFARFLSASAALPELIPAHEGRRLRFCPLAVRDCLEPSREPTLQPPYPYRTLSGLDSLVPGQGVELQWKMQEGSPFGWWYGLLETLACDPDGSKAVATITFPHFHRNSYWHQVEVTFGDGVMRSCLMGGFNGGVRPCTRDEEQKWAGLLPAQDPSL